MTKKKLRSREECTTLATQIIVEQLGVDEEEVTLDADFEKDLSCDSLDIIELVMAFEEEFTLEIPDDDAEKIKTVRDAMEYLYRRACEPLTDDNGGE